jgi:hypothetical protein
MIVNKKVNFCSEVRTSFAFLVQDKGFQVCRESSTDGLEYVEFRSDSTFVRVLCTGPDFEPRMVFGRNGCDGVKGSESFDWVDLKELDCCKSWTWSSSSDKPYDGRLFELARLLRECGDDCLRGSDEIYRAMAKRREELRNQHIREERRLQVERAAELAWVDKRYREYVELLGDSVDELSATARSRVEFARKNLHLDSN